MRIIFRYGAHYPVRPVPGCLLRSPGGLAEVPGRLRSCEGARLFFFAGELPLF